MTFRFALGLMLLILGMTYSQCTNDDPKYKLYFVEGQRLYLTHCSNCHQQDGKGLRKLYPPLAASDFMEKNVERVACAMKYGMRGEIEVNGTMYRQTMPGVAALTELEVAEISTYIYNSWGHEKGLIDVKRMTAIMETCETR